MKRVVRPAKAGLALLTLALLPSTVATSHAATCSTKVFVEAPHYAVGLRPVSVVTADFDGDTFEDIATANSYSASVSVLLNEGDGTFGPAIETEIEIGGAFAIAAADFDDDGSVDLAVGYYSELFILLGHGDGTFDPPVDYTTGNGPIESLLPSSLDAGGTVDLVVTSEQSNEIVVLLGDGDGTFGPPASFPAGSGARYAVLGDFDGNGDTDVVAANSASDTVSLLLGFGDGTFAPPTAFVAGSAPLYVVAGDFDDDGDLDVAVTAGSYISVLKGNGSGSFSAARQYPARNPRSLAAADFTGDGILDLAALHRFDFSYGDSDSTAIFAGDGTGAFAPTGSEYLSGYSGDAIAVGDLDSNGAPDLVVANVELNQVTVLLATGSGGFIAGGSIPTPFGSETLAEGDFNGDAIPDLAIAGASAVAALLGNGQGGFETSYLESSPDARSVITGLFTSDADLDLLVLGYSDIRLFRGRGDGTFDAPASPIQGIQYPWRAVAGDFDGNGALDFALTRDCCGNPSVDVYLGNGQGDFVVAGSTPTVFGASDLLAQDFNGDGDLDVAATSPGSNRVLVLLGHGDGTLAAPENYPTDSQPTGIAAGDLNGDGELDLVTSNSGSFNLSVLIGDGDGTFPGGWTLAVGRRVVAVAVADLNDDGLQDIATANDDTRSAFVFLSHGGGKFASPEEFTTDRNPRFLSIADFDTNGYPDLVTANPDASSITLLSNSRLGVGPLPPAGACLGGAGSLRAFAAGYGSLAFQWRKDGVDLPDGGHISGATTATLTIDPAGVEDEGDYDVVVTDLCTSVTSNSVPFIVSSPPSPPAIQLVVPPAPGLAGVASTPDVPGHTYAWTIGGNTDAQIVSGQGTAQITFLAEIPGNATLEVVEYSATGCGVASTAVPVPVDFFDVPAGHPFHSDIVEIARAGITAGCGDGNYCPSDPVTRAQMAPLLLRSLHGSSWTPPFTGTYFNDVPPGSFAADWINYLASQSITGGCGDGIYCPDSSVTRAQMAVFILKTLGNYFPPFGSPIFDDVPPGAFAYNFINEIHALGITGGCSVAPPLYCPTGLVTRGQMAAFLVRAFLDPAP